MRNSTRSVSLAFSSVLSPREIIRDERTPCIVHARHTWPPKNHDVCGIKKLQRRPTSLPTRTSVRRNVFPQPSYSRRTPNVRPLGLKPHDRVTTKRGARRHLFRPSVTRSSPQDPKKWPLPAIVQVDVPQTLGFGGARSGDHETRRTTPRLFRPSVSRFPNLNGPNFSPVG